MITRVGGEGREISNCTAGADLTQVFTKIDLVPKYYGGWERINWKNLLLILSLVMKYYRELNGSGIKNQ